MVRKPRVALVSDDSDLNLHFIKQILQHRNIEYFEINPIVRERNFELNFELMGCGASACEVLAGKQGEVSLDNITSVWSRGVSYFGGRMTKPGTKLNLAHYESIYTYEYMWWRLRDRVWVNPLLCNRIACNRLIQSQVAAARGLRVPNQIVSTSERDISKFCQIEGVNITKTISQGGMVETGGQPIKTEYFRAADVSEERGRGLLAPALVQNYIDKDHELRVVVVGDKIYAAAIDSALDERTRLDSRLWQGTGLTYYRVRLSYDDQEILVNINRDLGLVYSSIDLVRGKDGFLYFLEVNPAGQWSFIEAQTGYPVTEQIVNYLEGAK